MLHLQSTHKRELPSFFFTNNIGAPHDEVLDRMKCFSISSSICFLSSTNSAGAIRYEVIDTGLIPGTKLIENFTSLLGGNPGTSSGNTSSNSYIAGMTDVPSFSSTSIRVKIMKHCAPL